ncbi:unnamed protein product [Gongylonema pulchrum]|uniref:Uncharacterized protein n=1 Tax=Gongylonema pulchrum TaxID=637853 RepID=A0A183EZP4_9BILA|nr:unnamed protein product [Gongylonema pulchrum]
MLPNRLSKSIYFQLDFLRFIDFYSFLIHLNGGICVFSIKVTDSLKYGEYKQSTDLHVVRVTQKDILIDAVIFHERSLQINFHCL